MTAVLLLNADMTPIRVLNLQRALSLIFKDRVDFIQNVPDKKLRSPSTELPYPSILRLKRYVNVPRRGVQWSRRGVFARDSYRCVYCNSKLDRETATVDHLIPREICSKNGIKASTWTNSVTSCAACNRRKANRRLEDSGMKFYDPGYIPRAPRANYVILSGDIPSEWKAYIRS